MKHLLKCFVLLPLFVHSGCQSFSEMMREVSNDVAQVASPPAPQPEPYRKRILILKFTNKTSFETAGLQETIFSEFRSAALRTADVVLVTEDEIDKGDTILGDESGYHYGAIFDLARAHGFSGVIVGGIEDLSLERKGDNIGMFPTYEFALSAKVSFSLYETATERELVTRNSSAELTKEYVKMLEDRSPASTDETYRLQDAVAQATRKVTADFPQISRRVSWGGQIIKIDRLRFYINAGEETGIQKGQLLKVLGQGFPVVDDKTKVSLGHASGPVKGILKIVDYLGRDGAVAVVHSGGGFGVRDRVEVFTATP